MNQEAGVAVWVLMSGVFIIDHSIPCCITMERGDTDCGAVGVKTSCDQQKKKKKKRRNIRRGEMVMSRLWRTDHVTSWILQFTPEYKFGDVSIGQSSFTMERDLENLWNKKGLLQE